jgi:hypothetical protein
MATVMSRLAIVSSLLVLVLLLPLAVVKVLARTDQ